MSDDASREEVCPDCQAGPDTMDARITRYMKDPATGELYRVVTWHLEDCPSHTVEQILMEDGVRRAKEKDAWAEQAFPAAYERVLGAVMAGKFSAEAEPFVRALVELVEAQREDMGRFVTLDRWAEILDQHFPADGAGPVRPDEETTS